MSLEQILSRLLSCRRILNAAASGTPVSVWDPECNEGQASEDDAAALAELLEEACRHFDICSIQPVKRAAQHCGAEGVVSWRLGGGEILREASRGLAKRSIGKRAVLQTVHDRDPRRRFDVETFRTDGGRPLRVYSRGSGEAPACVVALPYGLPAEAVFDLANQLSRGHRFLAFEGPDLVSHPDEFDGLSHGIESTAHDILSVLDRYRLSRIHLVGVCGSAKATVRLASLHPDRVASLTLGNGTYPSEALFGSDASRMLQTVGGSRGRARVMCRFMGAQDLASIEPDCPHVTMVPYVNPDLLYMLSSAVRSMVQSAVDEREFDEWLADVACPSLVIVSERDTLVDPADSHRVAEKLRRCHKIVDPTGSHLSLLSGPSPTLLGSVLRFYAENGR